MKHYFLIVKKRPKRDETSSLFVTIIKEKNKVFEKDNESIRYYWIIIILAHGKPVKLFLQCWMAFINIMCIV